MATRARDWKRPETFDVILPSGNEIECRKVDLMGLIENSQDGDIPNGLLNQIMAGMGGKALPEQMDCKEATELPRPGDVVRQGDVVGFVIEVSGMRDIFTLKMSQVKYGQFKPGQAEISGGRGYFEIMTENNPMPWQPETIEDVKQMARFSRLICCAGAVNPKLVMGEPITDDELSVDVLTDADRSVLMAMLMPGEVRAAGRFSEEPQFSLVATSDVQGISPESGG